MIALLPARPGRILGLLVVAGTLSACGSSSGDSSTASSAEPGQATSTSAAASAPTSGSAAASAARSDPASQSAPAAEPAATETAAAASAACTPGPTTIKGIDVVQHCGPATGQFTVGGKTVKVVSGKCETSMGAWSVNIGATVVDTSATSKQRGSIPYLGIVAGTPKTDGSGKKKVDPAKVPQKEVLVAFHGGGTTGSILPGKVKFRITGAGPRGTFSGPTIKGEKATGSFNCG